MTALLTQRKYRLAARLATDTARTFGLWLTAAFVILLVGSLVYRAVSGEYAQVAQWAILAIPLVMAGAAWFHLVKGQPRAIANGLTRKEFITAFALYGAVTVATAALLTHLGIAVIGLFATYKGAEHGFSFYGTGWLDSFARPALWFAIGAAAGAAMLRFGTGLLGAFLAGLIAAAGLYRSVAISLVVNADGESGTLVEVPVAMNSTSMAWVDLALTAAFALLALALLARAPMRPKPA